MRPDTASGGSYPPYTFSEWCLYLALAPTADQCQAAWFLEANGQQFLVHFGIDNVLSKAHALWREQGAH